MTRGAPETIKRMSKLVRHMEACGTCGSLRGTRKLEGHREAFGRIWKLEGYIEACGVYESLGAHGSMGGTWKLRGTWRLESTWNLEGQSQRPRSLWDT